MIVPRNVVRNIRNNAIRDALTAIVCAAITLLVFAYHEVLSANVMQLKELPDFVTVTAQVCNPTGSQTFGLQIAEQKIGQIEQTKMVKELRYTTRMAADAAETPTEMPQYGIWGINDIGCMEEELRESIDFTENYQEDIFRSEEAVCIVPKDFEGENERFGVGSPAELALYYFDYSEKYLQYRYIGDYLVRIVGTYDPVATRSYDLEIICPVAFLKNVYRDAGEPFMADSAAFKIKDLSELNHFKQKMKEIGFLNISATRAETITGSALVVNDKTFIKSARSLEKNVHMLKGLLPAVNAAAGLVGFVVFCLFALSEKKSFELMRSLGVSRRRCFILLTTESMVLAILGISAGLAAAMILLQSALTGLVQTGFTVFMCLMSGSILSGFLFIGNNSVRNRRKGGKR